MTTTKESYMEYAQNVRVKTYLVNLSLSKARYLYQVTFWEPYIMKTNISLSMIRRP